MPWYLRFSKCLPASVTRGACDVQAATAAGLRGLSGPGAAEVNHLRFQLPPRWTIALAARSKRVGEAFEGHQRELCLHNEQPDETGPYERLLGNAAGGNQALFTRQDAVEVARAIVDPVLTAHGPAIRYKPGTWGPVDADALVSVDGGWRNPAVDE